MISYTTVMGGLRRAGGCQHVLDLLKVMPTKGVTPNNYTYRAALLACAQVKFGSVLIGSEHRVQGTLLVYSGLQCFCRTLAIRSVWTFVFSRAHPVPSPVPTLDWCCAWVLALPQLIKFRPGFKLTLSRFLPSFGARKTVTPFAQAVVNVVHIQLGKFVLSVPSRYQRTV